MAGTDDFDEDDWREVLAELRLLILSAGFVEWDASMAAALDEEAEADLGSPRWQVLRYAKSFAIFLSVRSEENLERMRGQMGELIRTERAQPITDAVVREYDSEESISLLAGNSDALLAEVRRFVNALLEDTGYFADPEFDE